MPTQQHFSEQVRGQAFLLHPNLIRLLPQTKNLRCLELGSGEGAVLEDVFRAKPTWRMTAADSDAAELAKLKDRLPVETKAADLREPIPFEDSSFDVAYMVSTALYFDRGQFDAVVNEVRRILAPGGTFLVADPHPDWQRKKLLQADTASEEIAPIQDSWQGIASMKWWRSKKEYFSALQTNGFQVEQVEIQIPDAPEMPERYRVHAGTNLYLISIGIC